MVVFRDAMAASRVVRCAVLNPGTRLDTLFSRARDANGVRKSKCKSISAARDIYHRQAFIIQRLLFEFIDLFSANPPRCLIEVHTDI